MSEAPLVLEDVRRTFIQASNKLEVLRGVSLSLGRGEVVALVGPSGAGKSTLLHIAGLLEHADGGEVLIEGRACSGSASPGSPARPRASGRWSCWGASA